MNRDILIVDDDRKFIENLKYILNQDSYKIDSIYTSKPLFKKLKKKDYDLIVLEREIANACGIEVCKMIRKFSTIPIIVISNNKDEISKIIALENGADDYMVKPFNISELKARIDIIFRRMEYEINIMPRHIFSISNYTINFLKKSISIDNKKINLTGKEFDLFYILSSNAGKIFSRQELLDEIWGYDHFGDIRTVDVHIRRIREKIEKNAEDARCIMTKWGEGYYFNDTHLTS